MLLLCLTRTGHSQAEAMSGEQIESFMNGHTHLIPSMVMPTLVDPEEQAPIGWQPPEVSNPDSTSETLQIQRLETESSTNSGLS